MLQEKGLFFGGENENKFDLDFDRKMIIFRKRK